MPKFSSDLEWTLMAVASYDSRYLLFIRWTILIISVIGLVCISPCFFSSVNFIRTFATMLLHVFPQCFPPILCLFCVSCLVFPCGTTLCVRFSCITCTVDLGGNVLYVLFEHSLWLDCSRDPSTGHAHETPVHFVRSLSSSRMTVRACYH
jgi:hypothetical protein